MRKNTLYIIIAAIAGLLLGYLFFGGSDSSSTSGQSHDHNSEAADHMWTCSMHPQIMQPEAGDCPICGMDLIPAETGSEGVGPDQITMTENAMALANVETTVVGSGDFGSGDAIVLSGTIAVNEEAMAVQASYFDGRLEKLNVNYEGQQVRKGQLLATIFAPELVAAQQELLTAASQKESQPKLYQAVRNKLKFWKLTDEQINGIENSGKVHEFFPVYATVSGTVSEVMSAEGDYIKQGQPIARVISLSSVWAEFDAYENQISQIKEGREISITTKAYPDQNFEGQVSFISPVLDNATRTFTVRAILNNQKGLFKPGMFVNGQIRSGVQSDGDQKLFVPVSAVMWTGERSLVYVKARAELPVFEMRAVTLGERIGESYTIASGLQAGEEVVTNGTFTVDAAAQLQGKKSMMNPEGASSVTGHEHHSEMQPDQSMEMDLPESFQKGFIGLLPSYLKMKDAFVASDARAIAGEASALGNKMNNLDDSSLGKMEKEYFRESVRLIEKISGSAGLKEQRAYFVNLNERLITLASHMQLNSTFYVQQCPMANNNKGAIWLSAEEKIRNPYYGDEMLTCGKVEQVLN
ncbi:efflux RND transporter periplasmic adaptor subunit [Lentiprolixibacter aurantiacus]|uniref:Efflux RND transporter periplasmic adaptor subunit n=1 Tax=Lentiprolixibacter aurantiacus TaxID=2993939 RepID=A0AAE3MN95_9FLAO|nr:efflux RND transporter periplasmic adaptor subunit [Lentiprolixibacter aurantiacus]MCX2720338.1 efflux RND transporter periplasmic adaptor subunit [Lentiprolixibacter aurantiacus]